MSSKSFYESEVSRIKRKGLEEVNCFRKKTVRVQIEFIDEIIEELAMHKEGTNDKPKPVHLRVINFRKTEEDRLTASLDRLRMWISKQQFGVTLEANS